ncbi:PREDICTED: mediator of DNA damage checkpoint protein 1 [Cyprinodon variegatus]|uniref:Mediator of DNA damage checkpoint protein 1 n=1 Tax=Cyprinodon variegatus TaxID=28743 RepID=A0A3Q2G6R4_CYPVA|nr:PREDICTED: mediator of DNA damage checkpoint protein 1 [Cyprinodon variegatus]
MDATQAISDSILESEEEESEEESKNETRKPLAKLCVLTNPHIPEKEFPLFLGDNILGRDPNICTLQLLAPSVSKQHATVSISVYRRRGRDSKEGMEALVWDLGSMNGTRKGHLKLTPHVRYALSEGDTLVFGNIPCHYVSSRSEEKRMPIIGGCLSIEQTPVQPHGTLVPESDSDSESERGARRDRKQKTIVSDSDSHKSSPSSSAFLSPPNKVVPESEDESPVTPSSSIKNLSNRHVSFSLEETDGDVGRQRPEKDTTAAFVENHDEKVEGAAEENGNDLKIHQPLNEDGESPGSTSVSRDAIPEFNLDSDTDVEEGEEEVSPAGQNDQPPNPVLSHMDSDTDVDDDTSDKVPKTSPAAEEKSKPSAIQLEGIAMDSDTDVDDDANVSSKATLFQGQHTTNSAPSLQPGDFHLDSDTDVDEQEDGGEGVKQEDPKTDKALNDPSDKPTPTVPHDLHPSDDGCNEAVDDPSMAASGASSEGRAGLDILSDSDTDVEEDRPPAISAAPASGALEPDSSKDRDVKEPILPQAEAKGSQADLQVESDTDVEDEKAVERQIPNLLRENTPGSLVPLLQNCSTPVQLSEGEVEQMETQAFTSPTSGAHRYAGASSLGAVVFSSCSDSQEDGDYDVAETQSFILQDRDSYKGLNPELASEIESSAVQPEETSTRGDSFQLGLSDSSHLQGEFKAVAMENTQAYISEDGVNLEDTLEYVEGNSPTLEATQPYSDDMGPSRCLEMSRKEGCGSLAMEATQAYIPEPYDEGSNEDAKQNSAKTESVVSTCSSTLPLAETQTVSSSSSEPNNPVGSLEPAQTGVRNETEELQESQSVAETQPMCQSDEEERDAEGLSSPFLKPAEEQKHHTTSSALSLAETQPMCTSDDEASDDDGLSAESLQPLKVETQPVTHSALTLAETQPVDVDAEEAQSTDLGEGDASNADDSEMLLPRKRKAKQLHIDEEESQETAETQPVCPSDDDDDLDSMPCLRKRKAKPLQLEDETQSLVGSQSSAPEPQPSATCEEEQSSEDFITTRKRKAKQLNIEDEQTQPLISSELEDKGLSERVPEAAGVSAVEAQAEVRDGKCDVGESITYAGKRKEKQLHLEEEEMQPITVSEVSLTKIQRKADATNVSPSRNETREQNKSDSGSCQKEMKAANRQTRGRRNVRKQEEDDDEEDKNKSTENESQIKQQRDKKQGEDIAEEHVATEKERDELVNETQTKRRKREEKKSQHEIEDQREASLETRKQEEPEARLEETAKSEEKQLQDLQNNNEEEENHRGSVRTRRSRGRGGAGPHQSSTFSVSEDVPARRTRSSSVSSERSVSSINDKTQESKGRGRGAKRSSDTPKTAVRSSRRRTATEAAEQDGEAQMLSASPKASSKASSTTSQNRGRGGRPRGRGRKTSHSNIIAPDIRDSTERSRLSESSSTDILQQDKRQPSAQLTVTSRGQQRVGAKGSEDLALNNKGRKKNQEKAEDLNISLPKRNSRSTGPKAVKAEPVEETEAPTVSYGEEARDESKANTEADGEQKPKEEQNKEIPFAIPGRRTSRALSTRVKKSEKSLPKNQVEDGKKGAVSTVEKRTRAGSSEVQKNKKQGLQETKASDSSMEQDGAEEVAEHPQTPAATPSRKRRVSSNSSPVAKTPRSSSASPATISRLGHGSPAYKVLFTGVVDESGERVLARLGGAMAQGVSDMNCLVTDKVRRTVKFLCAVAKGVPVVTTQWLEKSGKAGSFLSPNAFVVKDPEQEKKFSFSLQESLRVASGQPLLQGYQIHVTKSVKPEPVHMKDIITCSGATFLPKMPKAHKPLTVVISCEEDLHLCVPAMSASLPVVTAEFILTGILQQRVDLQTHALSAPAARLEPAEGRGRGRRKT